MATPIKTLKSRFVMPILLMPFLLFFGLQGQAQNSPDIVFYVSPQGNDKWSGKIAVPNAEKKDGPFATLAKARDAIRELKRANALAKPVKIFLRGGTHFLKETLVLTEEDSGEKAAPITYSAYPGEKPIVSGGFLIRDWQKEGKFFVASVPGVREGKVHYFQQLFVNNQRAVRARTPDSGFFRVANPPQLAIKANKYSEPQHSFQFFEGDLNAGWTNLNDAKVVLYNLWLDFHLPIDRIDEGQKVVYFKNSMEHMLQDNHNPEGARYFVENVFEALDSPGEWYLDRQKEKLFYYPKKGEDIKGLVVIAPRLETLISIQGNPEKGKFVQYINWEGITFSHNEWNIPENVSFLKQAADLIEANAIEATGLKNASFSKCTFTRLGTYGLEISNGGSHNLITRCVFKDCGGGGVKLSGSTLSGPEYNRNGFNVITDCEVTDCGKIHPSTVGLFLKHTANNLVSHNYIHHLPYTGISVGFDWDFKPTVSQNNIVEWNALHDIGMGVLSDMGAIYTQGVMPGTIISNNLIRDVKSWRALAHGIYLDGATAKVKVENNLVYNCGTTVIFQSRAGRAEAKDNVIQNNIFAFGGNELINLANKEEGKLAFTASRNIFLANGTPLIGSHYNSKVADPVFQCKNNLYWNIGVTKPFAQDHPKFGKGHKPLNWNDWLSLGQDAGSVYADPLFINPLNGDFTLRKNSPARRIGFIPFNLKEAGIRPEKGKQKK